MSRLSWVVVLMALWNAAQAANAASVALVYVGDNPHDSAGALFATPGDILTFDVIWDFTDAPTIGGSFDIVFNPDALAFDSYQLANICNDPDCYGGWWGFDLLEDRFAGWSYGSIDPIDGVLNMGSITFEFIAHNHSRPFLYGAPGSGIGGPFISGEDYVSVLDVTFNEITLAPIPLPGAVWLFLGAIGVLVSRARK